MKKQFILSLLLLTLPFQLFAEPQVSITIPMYNSASYIERTIKSAQNQTLEDIEIVCVDDCSTDNTVKIVNKMMKNDKRIRLIRHKQNKGTLCAMMSGIRACKGEYIWCVDHDDYLCHRTAELAYARAKETNADIVLFTAIFHSEEGDYFTKIHRAPTLDLIGHDELYDDFLSNKIGWPLWFKLVRRELLVNACDIIGDRFDNAHHLSFADALLTTIIMSNAKSCAGISYIGYQWNIENQSISHSTSKTIEKAKKNMTDTVNSCQFLLSLPNQETNSLYTKLANEWLSYLIEAVNTNPQCVDELADIILQSGLATPETEVVIQKIINLNYGNNHHDFIP